MAQIQVGRGVPTLSNKTAVVTRRKQCFTKVNDVELPTSLLVLSSLSYVDVKQRFYA